MSANVVAFLYLASGVLFILALRGLSNPETSRTGNTFGIVGMVLAMVTTLALVDQFDDVLTWAMIVRHPGRAARQLAAVLAQRSVRDASQM